MIAFLFLFLFCLSEICMDSIKKNWLKLSNCNCSAFLSIVSVLVQIKQIFTNSKIYTTRSDLLVRTAKNGTWSRVTQCNGINQQPIINQQTIINHQAIREPIINQQPNTTYYKSSSTTNPSSTNNPSSTSLNKDVFNI